MEDEDENFQGFYFDPVTGHYFREAPAHLGYQTNLPVTRSKNRQEGADTSKERVIPRAEYGYTYTQLAYLRPDLMPKTLFSLTAHISRFLDPFRAVHYSLPHATVCSVSALEMEASMSGASIPLTPEASALLGAPRVVRDMMVNRSGDMIISSTRLPTNSALFFVSELNFDKHEKKAHVKPITLELCRNYSMLGTEIGISGNGKSDIVVHYEALPSCGYVLARTYRPGSDGEVSQETLSSRWYKTDAARWPMTLEGVPNADAIACTPSLSREVVGAISTIDGEVNVLCLPNASDMTLLQKLNTPDKSSALSLTFLEDPQILHVGTRSGTIVSWDLRCESSSPSSTTTIESSEKVRPSVIQMHSVGDNYLVTNCLDSKLLLWDWRMNRQVLSYPTHVNSHHPCRSIVDSSRSFVAAVGDDRSIRLWSLWKGLLLRCIKDTEYSTKDLLDGEFPAIAYSESLGGNGGVPSLLVATHEALIPFSL